MGALIIIIIIALTIVMIIYLASAASTFSLKVVWLRKTPTFDRSQSASASSDSMALYK